MVAPCGSSGVPVGEGICLRARADGIAVAVLDYHLPDTLVEWDLLLFLHGPQHERRGKLPRDGNEVRVANGISVVPESSGLRILVTEYHPDPDACISWELVRRWL